MPKFKTVCGVIAFVMFFVMLGAVGAVENDALPLLPGAVRIFAALGLSREIICPQTCDRRQEDHDLAISENRRGPVPVEPRHEERPLGRTVPDHEVRPEVEGR